MQTNTFIGVILFPAHSLLLASIDFSTADHITATLCIADGTGRLLCYDATMNGQIARTGFRYQDLYLLLRVLEIVRGAYQAAWDSATSDLLTAAGSVKTKFGIEANSRPVGLTKSDDGPPSDWDIFVGDSQAEELIEVKSGAISKADREVFWRRLRRELAQIEQRRGPLVPALVINPAKAGNLKIWKDLAQAALIYTGNLPGTRPPRVDSNAVF